MNLDLLPECRRCGLCETRISVVTPRLFNPDNGTHRALLVAESPDRDSDLLGQPLMDRAGEHVKRLLARAKLSCHITYAQKCIGGGKKVFLDKCKAWLWHEIKFFAPKVIITLGAVPSRLLLRDKDWSASLGELKKVDYTPALIAPWKAPATLLRGGAKLDEDTVEFFRKVRDVA